MIDLLYCVGKVHRGNLDNKLQFEHLLLWTAAAGCWMWKGVCLFPKCLFWEKKKKYFHNVVIVKIHIISPSGAPAVTDSLFVHLGQNSFEALSVRVVSQYMYFLQSEGDVVDSVC